MESLSKVIWLVTFLSWEKGYPMGDLGGKAYNLFFSIGLPTPAFSMAADGLS